MNQDQAKGKWNQLKGRAKKAWGVLADDKVKQTEGSLDEIHGAIQEKVGDAKEAIRSDVAKLQANADKGMSGG